MQFIEVQAAGHLSQVSLERVDHLGQVVGVDGHVESKHLGVLAMELSQ